MTEQPSVAVPASAYMSLIARRLAWRLWWIIAAALAAIAIGVAIDLRVSIVGLMLLLVIYPAVMSFAVLVYGLKQEVVDRTHIAQVSVSDDSLEVHDDRERVICVVKPAQVRSLSFTHERVTIAYGSRVDDVLIIPREMLTADDLDKLQGYRPMVSL